ncbi:hypothetical protein ISCGN_026543 [Ixodes scapularis]
MATLRLCSDLNKKVPRMQLFCLVGVSYQVLKNLGNNERRQLGGRALIVCRVKYKKLYKMFCFWCFGDDLFGTVPFGCLPGTGFRERGSRKRRKVFRTCGVRPTTEPNKGIVNGP